MIHNCVPFQKKSEAEHPWNLWLPHMLQGELLQEMQDPQENRDMQ